MDTPPALVSAITDAERTVQRQLAEAEGAHEQVVADLAADARGKARELLADDPRQRAALEAINRLTLRLELLRNLRLNWRVFEADAAAQGVSLRLNQLDGLRQLVQFLEDAGGDGDDPSRDLMGYYHQPTGAGKTGLFAIESRLLDVPTLILVPFDNLLTQTRDDLVRIGGFAPQDVGLVGGGEKEWGRKVTVATYAGHSALLRRNPDYRRSLESQCKLVICDEVHTALGGRTQESVLVIDGVQNGELSPEENASLDAEQEVLDRLGDATLVRSLKVGFTATPRLAAKHVEQYFPHRIGRVHHADLVGAGVLVPYRIVQCDGTVLEGEIESLEKLTQQEEAAILQREGIYGKLLGKYAEALATYRGHKERHSFPLRGMAFCTSHAECETFAEEAKALGIRCEIVTGREARGKAGRELILAAKERLVKGETDLIVTVEKLCAGFNFPEVNAVVWARITSMAKTIQGVGRGARAHRENGWTKDCCYVYETNWELQKNAKRGRRPLRIADALAQNGEDPERICGMADGTELEYEQPVTAELLRETITSQFTPEQWAAMKQKKKQQLKVNGLGLYAVARAFGVEGNPIGYHDVHLALGKAVWGEHPAFEQAEATPETLRPLIRQQFTLEQWAGMKNQSKSKLKINGLGLVAIASVFGVIGDPVGNHAVHLALGKAIWGEKWEDPDEALRNQLRTTIQSQLTPQQWAGMNQQKEKKPLKLLGLKLNAIARAFGVAGDPVDNHAVHLALGKAIWGEHLAFEQQEITADVLRAAIKGKFTPKQWAGMGKTEKKALKINGLGLKAVARAFGVEGNPISYHAVRLALGKAIWGEEWQQ